jgi:sodium/bile acid cotransporter 7
MHPTSGRIPLVLSLLAALAVPPAAADRWSGNKARVYELYADYKGKAFPQALDISARTLMTLMDSLEVVLVDVREPGERAVSMLPGAITEETYLADPGRYDGALVVSYCTIGYRSGVLAVRMAGEGRRMVNIKAGLLGWVHEGGAVHDPSGRETKRIHVYGRTWNLPPAGFTSVW